MRINAHRGDPLHYRENTMPSFASAVALGADCIELDVRTSLDEQAVVLHDETLDRLWGHSVSIRDANYSRILSLTKQSDMYVPKLEEVLGTFDIPVMVDFVDTDAVKRIVDVLVQEQEESRCIISSGNIDALMIIRDALKDVAIALTWNDIIPPSEHLLNALDVQYFNPYYRLYQDDFVQDVALQSNGTHTGLAQAIIERRHLHPEWYQHGHLCGTQLASALHETGHKLSAWTVDPPSDMRQMMQLGIDLLTTNDIRTGLEVRNG